MSAGLPNIVAQTSLRRFTSKDGYISVTATSGAFSAVNVREQTGIGSSTTEGNVADLSFDASRCSAVYNNDVMTVQPNSLTCLLYIKY